MSNPKTAAFDRYTTAEQVATALQDDIRGKNILITGTSIGGLGAECARVISKYANLIILAGRSQDKLDKTVEYLKKEGAKSELRTLKFDLASLESVRAGAAEVLTYKEPIHVLMNNAAYSIDKQYATSKDGVEIQFAAGQLAPFLFTNSIIPKLKEAKTETYTPRVIFVSSGSHMFHNVRYDDLNFQDGKEYTSGKAYSQTKSANIQTAVELARRYKGEINAYSLHPGVAHTPLEASQSVEDKVAMGLMSEDGKELGDLWRTLEECAATQTLASFDPALDNHSGAWLVDCQLHTAPFLAPHAIDPEFTKKTWALCEKLVGQTF